MWISCFYLNHKKFVFSLIKRISKVLERMFNIVYDFLFYKFYIKNFIPIMLTPNEYDEMII